MSTGLTEREMRDALGLGLDPTIKDAPGEAVQKADLPPTTSPKPKKRASPALRVTLRVTRDFEGEEAIFIHDVSTLSRFDAEQAARKAAAKEKYRFFELVSIDAVQ